MKKLKSARKLDFLISWASATIGIGRFWFNFSYFFDDHENTITWTTQGQKFTIDYMTFYTLLRLGTTDEKRTPIHNENKYKPKDLPFMFPRRALAIEGKADC
jgi:hypothetical protein